MDPAVISAIAAGVGTLGAAIAGWQARKIAGAEASKHKAEAETEKARRLDVIVDSATGAVALANSQMIAVVEEMTSLRHTVEDYKVQLQKAVASELLLRQDIGRLRKRVDNLEAYIRENGLAVPTEETNNENL